MAKKLGIVMDDIAQIKYHKDSSLAMLLEAKNRDYEIYYLAPNALFADKDQVFAEAKLLDVFANEKHWYAFGESKLINLNSLSIILMRKDPPFNMEYIYLTYLLELAEKQGVLVVNKPRSLRDANEKFFITEFPACIPETLIASNKLALRKFIEENHEVVLKPLHGMGGHSVFLVNKTDKNISVIIETLTENETIHIMAQQFIPEIVHGDKRILLIQGEPIPYALARIPLPSELRGNLAAGGHGEVVPLTERDYWICNQLRDTLKNMGLYFVGIDVIGDYLTEINVTSPTCIREIDAVKNTQIAARLFDVLTRS